MESGRSSAGVMYWLYDIVGGFSHTGHNDIMTAVFVYGLTNIWCEEACDGLALKRQGRSWLCLRTYDCFCAVLYEGWRGLLYVVLYDEILSRTKFVRVLPEMLHAVKHTLHWAQT
eukprot:scaffold315805_cov19-Tisochrysis_lutea.AAC.1